jgi:hypothetical protein
VEKIILAISLVQMNVPPGACVRKTGITGESRVKCALAYNGISNRIKCLADFIQSDEWRLDL